MTAAFKVCILGVSAAVIGLLVKKSNPELTAIIGIAAVTASLLMLSEVVSELLSFVKTLGEDSAETVSVVLKTAAIATVTRLSSELCRSCGQSPVAEVIELSGAAAGVYVTLPLIRTILKTIGELTK